ncbi:Metallo-hydrolase/oxidoreductase [Trametes cingulata]|nr:Metallo-hydrolase/oxidoreductase [Trametes cingulata]
MTPLLSRALRTRIPLYRPRPRCRLRRTPLFLTAGVLLSLTNPAHTRTRTMTTATASAAGGAGERARNVVVTEHKTPKSDLGVGEKLTRPAHHVDDTKTRFQNPWPSFRYPKTIYYFRALAQALGTLFTASKVPNDLSARIPSRTPDWGAGRAPDGVKATWLGCVPYSALFARISRVRRDRSHACFLVELPTPEGAARGPRILFDPVLSHRCSPVQWMGPARLLPTPCAAEDIPAVDAICISHNHYDHMDVATLRTVFRLHQPHVFAPLGNARHLQAAGIPPSHIHVRDWWDASAVSLVLPPAPSSASAPAPADAGNTGGNEGDGKGSGPGIPASFSITCTPAQHTANRSAFDRWRTLWSSWVVSEDLPSAPSSPSSSPGAESGSGRAPKRVYFAGDTGYRTVVEGEDEDAVPRCPAFREIGERFRGFDVALLPIGAYHPRWMFSGVHASPSDAVEIFKDVHARRALAMHWGTWTLTMEPTMEPPELLRKESARAGLEEGAFDVCGLGETRVF